MGINEKKALAILNKLPKTKLSKEQRTNLSLVSDLEDRLDELQYAFDDASYYGYERLDDLLDQWYDTTNPIRTEIDEMAINGNASNLPFIAEEVKNLLADFDEGMNRLGLDPREVLPNYDEFKRYADEADSVYQDFIRKYRETINITNNNDFIK